MKRISSLLVVSVLALSMLCACGSKFKTTDADTVAGILESHDIYDESRGGVREIEGIKKLETLTTNNWKCTFVNFGKDAEACDYEFEREVDRAGTVSRTTDGNYSVVEADDDTVYRLMIRVDNSYLVLMGGSDDKDDIRDLAREIGYYE